jgi:imidazolonepropionase-like amidohydrolase
MLRIEADLLIPGRGEPFEGACVVLDGGMIAYAGASRSAPSTPDATVTEVPVVLPGLWDAHSHFMGIDKTDIAELVKTPVSLAAARATADIRRVLDAGFTSVREVGGLGVHLARAVDEGSIPGPRIYGAGEVLSTTGGHGDIHAFRLDWIHSLEGLARLCDGVPKCLQAVRRQLRVGAKLIKVCASGGVMSELDDPIHQQFSDEELTAIVEEAGRAERVVAAHCHGKPGIMAALRAGCATIEHGSFLDEEAADLMLERDATLVPTRFIVETLLTLEGQVPEYAWRKTTDFADRHREAMCLAVAKGVRIAVGCDIFTSGPLYGRNGMELVHLVDAGMEPLAVIEAATANGPATLGPQAPRAGILAEGYDADVIAVAADPLDDMTVLAEPANVTHVWQRGALVKERGE